VGTERFSGVHEQRLLLNSTAVILQNLSVTTLIIRQLKGKGATNHERLRTTGLWLDLGFRFKKIFFLLKLNKNQKCERPNEARGNEL